MRAFAPPSESEPALTFDLNLILEDIECVRQKLNQRKAAFNKNLELHSDAHYETLPLNQRFVWNYVRHGPRIWYDYHFDSPPFWKDVHVNMPIFEHVWGSLFKELDITKGLSTLNKPVFLSLGRYDFIVAPPKSWNPLCSQFHDLTLCIFERSGHSPFYEEKELFDSKLLDW